MSSIKNKSQSIAPQTCRDQKSKSSSNTSKLKLERTRKTGADIESEIHDSNSPSLPATITRVKKVIDEDGRFTDLVAVKHISKDGRFIYSQLNFGALMNNNVSELSKLCIEHPLIDIVTRKTVGQLAQNIIGAIKGATQILRDDGFHRIKHNGDTYECFLWREKIYWVSAKPDFSLIMDSNRPALPISTCSLETWKEQIGKHASRNPYLLVTMCAALCSLIARWLELPSTALWVVGGSSLGKSSGQRAAQSLVQSGDKLISISGTPNGIRAKCGTFRDSPALLDEARQAKNPPSLINLIFDVANHASRTVGNSDQSASVGKELTCGLIISNERTIDELVIAKNVPIDDGLYGRVFEMAVNGPFGFFHKLPRGITGEQFSVQLQQRSHQYYGVGWDTWVRAVAKNSGKIKKSKAKKMEQIYRTITKNVDISDEVTKRLIRGVSAWAFAGYIASKLDILPATPDQIIDAFELVVREYVKRMRTKSTPIGDQIVECIRGCIDSNPGKFPKLETYRDNDQSGIYGYRRQIDGETEYLFFPTWFDKIVGANFGIRQAVAHLRKAEFLLTKADGDQLQVRLPGKPKLRKRFYAIKGAIRFDG